MANIKWSGIEKYKYNLDANWYVSAQYGNDFDIDGVGLFHPTNNPNGHGGKLRPFATIDKIIIAGFSGVIVFDSGMYKASIGCYNDLYFVGDGNVIFSNYSTGGNTSISLINIVVLYCSIASNYGWNNFIDCRISNTNIRGISSIRCLIVNCNILGESACSIVNTCIVQCNGYINESTFYNNLIVKSPNLVMATYQDLQTNNYKDFSVIIGQIQTNRPINGKSTVTIEDYKAEGKYFLKSFSEFDLFGNVSGTGATTEQLQEIFNGYFFPIMPDDLPFLDMSLKPTASNKIKYGGLNGYYIGALPVGYSFSAADLWNTWRDLSNTTNMKYDDGICLDTNQTSGTYRSVKISLPKPVIVDAVNFFNNLLYNESNIAAQRIDVTPDATPSNTLNQRTVYDYSLRYSPTAGGVLSEFKNFELNKPPYIDTNGNSALSDSYADGDRNLITIQDFIIEFKIAIV